ncbi:MAG: hypothetical protein ACI8TA_003422, partial [Cyclobacteriaceae bacterium]
MRLIPIKSGSLQIACSLLTLLMLSCTSNSTKNRDGNLPDEVVVDFDLEAIKERGYLV